MGEGGGRRQTDMPMAWRGRPGDLPTCLPVCMSDDQYTCNTSIPVLSFSVHVLGFFPAQPLLDIVQPLAFEKGTCCSLLTS